MSNAINRLGLDDASKIAESFKNTFVNNAIIVGSIRRKCTTIGDIDMMTTTSLSSIEKNVLAKGVPIIVSGTKILHAVYKDITINIYHYEKSYEGAMLMFLTGPSEYNIAYRRMAAKSGQKLNQYGLFDKNGLMIAGKTEDSIYAAFGKKWKEPCLRGA